MFKELFEKTNRINEADEVLVQAEAEGYAPYEGGGGPTAEQAEKNTKVFGQALARAGVEFKEVDGGKKYDTEQFPLLEFPDGDDVAYDRWGFTGLDLDNVPFREMYDAVLAKYKK